MIPRDVLHAEWTKLRTLVGTGWLLAAVVVLTTGLSVAAAAATECRGTGCGLDAAKTSLTGVIVGQAVVVILAVLAVSGEYGTGMVHVTFAAMPRRATVLAAKALVISGVVLVAGTVAVLTSVLAGRLVLPGNGFTVAHGYRALSLADGPVLRAAAGSVLYLVLIGLLSLGVAAALRDAAAAIGVVLGLLYLFPIVITAVGDPDWYRRLRQLAPMNAGLSIQDTVGLGSQPLSPWAGLGVLALWATGGLLAGTAVLRLRDA